MSLILCIQLQQRFIVIVILLLPISGMVNTYTCRVVSPSEMCYMWVTFKLTCIVKGAHTYLEDHKIALQSTPTIDHVIWFVMPWCVFYRLVGNTGIYDRMFMSSNPIVTDIGTAYIEYA